MSLFLVRDDDINATTDPARLERAYAPLLDAGIPISFAAIPEVALNTRTPEGTREPFLDPSWADSNACAKLHAQSPIAGWLRANVDRVDVLQHGLTHERLRSGTEFGALSRTEASARIATGHATLTRALGRAPSGFVAPWDRLSRGSLEATASVFDFVSTSWVSRDSLPIGALLAHVVERLRQRLVLRLGRTVVSRHLGGLVDARTNPDDVDGRLAAASSRASLTVVMLHHWMFWSSHEPHPVVRALARSLSTRRALRASDVPRMV